MKRTINFIALMLLASISIMAQTPTKSMIQPTSYQVVSCMSNTYESNSAQLNFTVGEVFVGASEEDNGTGTVSLFQGFQYPTVIFSSAQRLFANLFLEGPYNPGGNMNTYLSTIGVLPLSQPFTQAPYYYSGTESFAETTPEMVDWILIEARTGTPNLGGSKGTTTVETRAAMLMSDGTVLGEDAVEGVPFYNLEENQEHYFCVRHRNHLDVLTASPVLANSIMDIDFTSSVDQAFGVEQLKLSSDNVPTLHAGDFNEDGIIQTTDYDQWKIEPALNYTYWPTDGNLDGVVQSTDYDVWFYNKAKLGTVEIGF